MRKQLRKRALLILTIVTLTCVSVFPVYAAQASNGAEITTEITTLNHDTAFVCQLGEGILYIEVESSGMRWPLDTANPFAATVVTVADAQGNELGTLESTNGVIDYYGFTGAQKLICSTDFTKDVYEVELSQFSGTGISQPEYIPEGLGEGRQPSTEETIMGAAKIVTYIAMAIWVFIWIIVVVWLMRHRKNAKEHPLAGRWKLEITTPHGINEADLQLSVQNDKVCGFLNDSLNKEVPMREGKLTPDGFTGLINVDIGMNGTPEFMMEGKLEDENRLHGELILTAMTNIKSTFSAQKEV